MNAATLAKVMTVEGHKVTYSRLRNRLYFDKANGGPSFKATLWMAMLNQALIRARCTTPRRVAMFLAQLGAESGSFRYTQELASGSEYNWRKDLGNTHAGDGERYKGRTYIQVTGLHNYRALSAWAHSKGYVPTVDYFVRYPERLASVEYIFLGPVWYWTVARNMNRYADAMDINGATKAVNGGYNNLSGRTARWKFALTFGHSLLPTGVKAPTPLPPKHSVPVPVKRKPKPKPVTTYKVRQNDTLSSIATAHHTTWPRLQRLNNLSNPNLIYVGQTLRIG
jgi:predicted chitinase